MQKLYSKTMKIADLHIHSNFSFDGRSTMEEYVATALQRGVDILCFTEHVECSPLFETFSSFQFEQRAVAFDKLKARYGKDIKLLVGVEFGEPHLHQKEFEFVKSTNPDMIIGSVHYAMDYYSFVGGLSPAECVQMHNKLVYDVVDMGQVDVLGHLDLPKRYLKQRYVIDPAANQQILELCVKRGVVPEVNTSTLRRGLAQTMPSIDDLHYYLNAGGKYVAVNSDAHVCNELATNYQTVYNALPQGLSGCYFEKRTLKPLN